MKKYIKRNNYIDLTNLPTRKNGKITYTDWKNCYKEKVAFQFDDINDFFDLTFEEYNPETTQNKLKLEYNNNSIIISTGNLINIKIKNLIYGNPSDYKYEVNDIINGYKVLKKIRVRIGDQNQKGYLMLCLTYNETFEMSEYYVKAGFKSPYVTGRIAHKGNWLYSENDILEVLDNPEDAKKYTKGSHAKIKTVCPNCQSIKMYTVNKLVNRGFSCVKCSNHISYPEKLMISLLELNNIEYELQKGFGKLPKKRFDFYLPEYNSVIEMHGKQHYEEFENTKWDKLENIQQSDLIKKNFCNEHKIEYIEVNSSKSDMGYIIKNIESTSLKNIISNYDMKSLNKQMKIISNYKNVKEIINDYKNGNAIKDIAKKYHLNSSTNTVNLLRRLGVYEERPAYNLKKVICLNNLKTFDSLTKASMYAGLKNYKKSNSISKVCKGERNVSGKHPETGEPLKWMYYEDYITQQEML